MELGSELSRNPESEPDPTEIASRYGTDTTVIDRSDRLIYSFPPAAFDHVNRLVLGSADLARGFEFGGDRLPLINLQGTAASGIVPRCRARRLQRAMCDLPHP